MRINPPLALADKVQQIQSFHVMDIFAQAQALEREGKSIMHLEVGEPDFATPNEITEAGIQALKDNKTKYTPATGLPELKQAISGFYLQQYSKTVDPDTIIITPGASGALLLCLSVLLDSGDKVLMTDPGYPCNKNIVAMLGGETALIPVDEATNFLPSIDILNDVWDDKVKVLMLASPSNPTGSVIKPDLLIKLIDFCEQKNIALIVDEIYLGLTYDIEVESAVTQSDHCFVINSFSKYFCMTGWRLGWLVAPLQTIHSLDKVAQNIFLSAPTVAQYAALAAFDEDVIQQLELRRLEFKQRRDFLYPALENIGFKMRSKPQGAFYLYADCSELSSDSFQLVHDLLHQAGVAVTPGLDFGEYKSNSHIRFAYTQSHQQLQQAVDRMQQYFSV